VFDGGLRRLGEQVGKGIFEDVVDLLTAYGNVGNGSCVSRLMG
jgi:hypothetical protein